MVNSIQEWLALESLEWMMTSKDVVLFTRKASLNLEGTNCQYLSYTSIYIYFCINDRLHFIFSLSPHFDMSSSSMAFSVQAFSLLSTPKRLITYSLSRGVPNPVALRSNVTYSTSLCFNPTMFLLLRSLHKTFQIQLFCFWRSAMLRRAIQMYIVLCPIVCHAPHGDSDASYRSPDVLYVAPGISSLRSDFSHCTVLWNHSFWYPDCSRCFSSAASERLWKRLPFSPFFVLNTQNNPISDRRSRLCLSCTSDLTSEARIQVTSQLPLLDSIQYTYLTLDTHVYLCSYLSVWSAWRSLPIIPWRLRLHTLCMKCMTFLTYYPLET